MKLIFETPEFDFEIPEFNITSIDIENPVLFTRILTSLSVDDATLAPEKYRFYIDDKIVSFPRNSIAVLNPIDLPFKNSTLLTALYKKIEADITQDDLMLMELQELQIKMRSAYQRATLNYFSDYEFDIELDIKKYLKSFGFANRFDPDVSLIDNLMKFLEFVADISHDKVILIVNLKIFLSKNEYIELCKYAFFLKITLLSINSGVKLYNFDEEKNYIIDLDFDVFCN